MDTELNKITKHFLSHHVNFDNIYNVLTLHMVFKEYASDFGKDIKDVLKWIL